MRQSIISRRSLVKTGLLTLAGSTFLRSSAVAQISVAAKEPIASLPKVDIAANRVIRQVAGLRPFRASGFVVRAEAFGDKTLIHTTAMAGAA